MEKPGGLTAKGICDILKVCRRAGVQSLDFQELHVKFHADGEAKLERSPSDFVRASEMSAVSVSSPVGEDETLVKDEIRLREEQLSQLDMEDPAGYERLVLSGEMNDEATHDRRLKSAL